MPRLFPLALASVLGTALALPAAAASPTYAAVDLGTLSGCTYTEANGINNSGQVTGYCYGDTSGRGFVTGPNGVGMTDLGNLGGRNDYGQGISAGYGINDSGQVTGYSMAGPDTVHAFITGPGRRGMADLGTLGGHSYGVGINDAGRVVGNSYLADNYTFHALITGPNGQGMTDLGTLGGNLSGATDINNAGQVVGTSNLTPNGVSHAFVTGPNGIGMVDLNALVDLPGDAYLTYANGINDKGQIIAQGSDDHAYLISPWTVPEPETMALVLAGLGLAGFMARRR